jgi:hypothetical protein
MACYRDGFILLYADYVRTSQETRLWTSTALLRGRFIFTFGVLVAAVCIVYLLAVVMSSIILFCVLYLH